MQEVPTVGRHGLELAKMVPGMTADAVSHTVLPYSDQQVGGTVGGPIVKDKMHYFGAYEYERTPNTIYGTVQALGQSYSLPDTVLSKSFMLRVDNQLAKNDRLSLR